MLLNIKNLSIKTTNSKQTILENSCFHINEGETLGIIGESGSGKTMTGKAIMGLLDPSSFKIEGNILFCGQDLNILSEKERHTFRGSQIAMIMQNPMTAFAPMIKIGKQMTEALKFHLNLSKKELSDICIKEFNKINLPNAKKLMNSFPNELSGGMLQRIMISLTMLLKPKLIIADEATTAVDTISEKLIIEEFKKIKKNGISLLVITHDFGVAASLCDQIIVMQNGKIIEEGNIQRIFNNPKHSYTKELVNAGILYGDIQC